MTATAFDAPLVGRPAWMVRADGSEIVLPVRRWHATAAGEDTWLLDRCAGPVLDLGCGPGRMVSALDARGVPALGVDLSGAAIAKCRRRGVVALQLDVLGPLPGEGCWQSVLLADGNIGIGGDPHRLLRRIGRLLGPHGTVLVETGGRHDPLWCGTVRLRVGADLGPPLRWATVGLVELADVAARVGLTVTSTHEGRRSFAELRRR